MKKKIAEATKLKESGTENFKAGDFNSAIELYEKAISFVDQNEDDEGTKIWIACTLNVAQSHINLKQYAFAAQKLHLLLTKILQT